jgi:hypothetical protein
MPSTYDKIATYTVSGTPTSYTFTSIPQTFTDLVLVVNAKITSGSVNFAMQYNGNTGNNYCFTRLYADGSSALSSRAGSVPDNYMGDVLSSVWSNNIISIQNYANNTTYKSGISRSNSTGSAIQFWANNWISTFDPITQIKVYPTGGNTLSVGTMMTLYGIKAG